MLDGAEGAGVLFAVANGDLVRARELVTQAGSVPDTLRKALLDVLDEGCGPTQTARALGDAARGNEGTERFVNECYRVAFYTGDAWRQFGQNPLYAYFAANRSGALLDKWVHYFPIYHRHLERFRGRAVRVLEIGVYRAGGLNMWQDYFGADATIVGVDVDPAAQRAAGDAFVVELGDQEDPEFLRHISEKHGPFDVVIDDGGHSMRQQIVTSETLFPLLAEDGVLLVEDTHTSYWSTYGGGRSASGSFLRWAQGHIDDLHSFHDTSVDSTSAWATGLGAVHFYDSIVVFDRERRFAPFRELSGGSSFVFEDALSESIAAELSATRSDAAKMRLDLDAAYREVDRAHEALDVADRERRAYAEAVRIVQGSLSWRLTAPLRVVRRLTRRRTT
jgi:hypothetical protein